jgi:pimeloyl-[acyl-carrier protein] methyl ester esterase
MMPHSFFLIPGWGMTPTMFDPLLEHLPCNMPAFFNWSRMTAVGTTEPRNELLQMENSIFIGWSLGGMLAMEAILQGKFRPKGLILLNSSGTFLARGKVPGASPRLLRAMMLKLKKTPEEVLGDFADLCCSDTPSEEFRRVLIQQAATFSTESLVQGLAYLREFDLLDQLPELDVPTLVLHGRSDAVIPLESGAWLAERLQGATFHAVSGDHALPWTSPQKIAERILPFLDSLT